MYILYSYILIVYFEYKCVSSRYSCRYVLKCTSQNHIKIANAHEKLAHSLPVLSVYVTMSQGSVQVSRWTFCLNNYDRNDCLLYTSDAADE